MTEAVLGLGHIFSKKIVGCVTIIADGHIVMAGFLPAIILFLHDMAIGTRLGIVRKIRKAACIVKCVPPQPETNSHEQDKNEHPFIVEMNEYFKHKRFGWLVYAHDGAFQHK